MELYKQYLRIKLKYMERLDAFYNNDNLIPSLNKNNIVHLNYKRLRFNVYINTQRSGFQRNPTVSDSQKQT